MSKANWYNRPAVVIILLIIFWPLGLYGIWKNDQFSKAIKIALSGIPIVFMLFSHFLYPLIFPYQKIASDRSVKSLGPQPSATEFSIAFVEDGSNELDIGHAFNHYRFFRFNTDFKFNETPPSSITVSESSQSTSRTYLTHATYTQGAVFSPSAIPAGFLTGSEAAV